jgi:hypothetical protein
MPIRPFNLALPPQTHLIASCSSAKQFSGTHSEVMYAGRADDAQTEDQARSGYLRHVQCADSMHGMK